MSLKTYDPDQDPRKNQNQNERRQSGSTQQTSSGFHNMLENTRIEEMRLIYINSMLMFIQMWKVQFLTMFPQHWKLVESVTENQEAMLRKLPIEEVARIFMTSRSQAQVQATEDMFK